MSTRIEWPTLALFALTYTAWALALFWLWPMAPLLAVIFAGISIAQHSSLQHEAIHGHPFQRQWINTLVAGVPLTLVIPYLRFRATHLAHHRDCELTDPYDDPESNFMDGGQFDRLPLPLKEVLKANNTLVGRLIIGPAIGTAVFLIAEFKRRHTPQVSRDWLWHVVSVLPVLAVVVFSPMPVWAYLVACYIALALLRIRTFLEHQAHEQSRSRSVIIEDRGPLALLFLNNNLHIVHHMHPNVPWYRLPRLFRQNRSRYLKMNGEYFYRSYGEIFRRYLFKAKDPVAHPLWRRG